MVQWESLPTVGNKLICAMSSGLYNVDVANLLHSFYYKVGEVIIVQNGLLMWYRIYGSTVVFIVRRFTDLVYNKCLHYIETPFYVSIHLESFLLLGSMISPLCDPMTEVLQHVLAHYR